MVSYITSESMSTSDVKCVNYDLPYPKIQQNDLHPSPAHLVSYEHCERKHIPPRPRLSQKAVQNDPMQVQCQYTSVIEDDNELHIPSLQGQ
jgi:hypothetical protein